MQFSQYAVLKESAGSSGSEDANLVLTFLDRKAMSKVSLTTVRSSEAGPGLIGFRACTAGANPLMPTSPDIDTCVDFRASWGDRKAMQVSGTVSGDDFPNLAVFLRCYSSGKCAMLVDGRSRRDRYSGPMSLFGSGKRLCAFAVGIPLRPGGTFLSDLSCIKAAI